MKPVQLGTIEVLDEPMKVKKVKDLTKQDAILDGFENLAEFLIELAHLNRYLTPDTVVHIQQVRVLENVYESVLKTA